MQLFGNEKKCERKSIVLLLISLIYVITYESENIRNIITEEIYKKGKTDNL